MITAVIETVTVGPDDWQVWRTLRRAALEEAPHAFGSTLADWSGPGDTELRWRARLTSVPFNVVVLRHGMNAAMVSATVSATRPEVELLSLWVTPSARGSGVGDVAVRCVLDWASQHHPDRDVVLSVKADNQAARRLYERHGFEDTGPSPDDESERLMRRQLRPPRTWPR